MNSGGGGSGGFVEKRVVRVVGGVGGAGTCEMVGKTKGNELGWVEIRVSLGGRIKERGKYVEGV